MSKGRKNIVKFFIKSQQFLIIIELNKKVILSKSAAHLYMNMVVSETYQCQQGVFQATAVREQQGSGPPHQDRQPGAEGCDVTKQGRAVGSWRPASLWHH